MENIKMQNKEYYTQGSLLCPGFILSMINIIIILGAVLKIIITNN